MEKFIVNLVRLENPSDTKTVTVEADGAMQACIAAEKLNAGYLGVESNLVEEQS